MLNIKYENFRESCKRQKNFSFKKTNVPLLEPLNTFFYDNISACTSLTYDINGLKLKIVLNRLKG